jgi:hypothetical protein
VEEARCVETIASSQWRIARCRALQAAFDAKLGAALAAPRAGGARPAESEADWLFRRSMDCVLQEARLDRLMVRAEARLALLQRQRGQYITAREQLLDPDALLAAGDPAPEEAPDSPSSGDAAEPATAPAASAGNGAGIGDLSERNVEPFGLPLGPAHSVPVDVSSAASP